MNVTRKDVGYTIYSRLEESLRVFIKENLLNSFGNEWYSHIPEGIWGKKLESLPFSNAKDVDDPMVLLEETDIPDLMEIACHKKAFPILFPKRVLAQEGFREKMIRLYEIRNKIAHVKRTFTAFDLDSLIEIAKTFIPILGPITRELQETLDCIDKNPERVLIRIPPNFFIDEEQFAFPHINNLPHGDYDPDGGFIGRKEDLTNIEKNILGDLHRVVTISGAGGVGKTALAHQFCQNILCKTELPFDGMVWVSAKEEKLTLKGIEPIEPTFRNYEGVLDSILETFGWFSDLDKALEKKQESVDTILRAGEKGILLIVDNLETIQDERVIEFVKDFPPPSKVLITSRMGLGEVERRYVLKEMTNKDAITLLRAVPREKGCDSLAKLPEEILLKYANKMSRYPLAIKWVVGQVALGRDMDLAIGDLTSSKGDVAKFCFEHIFDTFLNEDSKMVLYALAAHDKPLVRGILSTVSNLSPEQLDSALKELTIASFVIPTQVKSPDDTIETRYELLPLTRNYIFSKLQSHPEINRAIKSRMEMVQNLIEEAERAGREYRYSLRYMGAESDEEKVAAMWATTAYQKYQAADHDGAVAGFERAAQIAPKFPAVYRNWATVESDAGFYERAENLMKKATSLAPNDSSIWFVWGNIEKRRQRYDRASEYLKKALDLSPNDAPILGALGEVEKRRGNFENADKFLRKALEEGCFDVSRRRHEIVCHTSLADNLRRWAEALTRDQRTDEALAKLKESYSFALKATELGKDDPRAQDTFREVSLDLAFRFMKFGGFSTARPLFENAIKPNPRRIKEKKTTEVACYQIANNLIQDGYVDEARKYFNLGRKLQVGDQYIEKYKSLALEFSKERVKGKLFRVIPQKGYGFLEPEVETGQTVYLHISEISPGISIEEFDNLQGRAFSFIIEKDSKGPHPAAKRARLVEDKIV